MRYAVLSVVFLMLSGPVLAAERAATPVGVARVTEVAVQDELPLVGSVIARRTSRISPQVEGLIEALFVEEGVEVKAGDPLFRLDDDLAQIAVTRAQAEVAEARARLEDVRRKLKEAESLLPKRAIPETAYETARIDVEASEATLLRLGADLERQKELLRRHTVQAPFDGAIVAKLAEVGQWIRTDTPVFELAEIATLRIEIPVPQQRYAAVLPGHGAVIQFDAVPGETFTGTVSRKIPSGRDAVRTFPVWIDFANDERRIAPGMSARVRLDLASDDAVATVVPNDALVRRADGEVVVWLVSEEESGLVAVPVPVNVGRISNGLAEVTSSRLKAGDRVVVRGNETLRPQQPVRVTAPVAMDS